MELFKNCPFCDFPIYGRKFDGADLDTYFCDKGTCRKFSQTVDRYVGIVYYTVLNIGNINVTLYNDNNTFIYKDNHCLISYNSGKYLGINLDDYLNEASKCLEKRGWSYSIKSTYIPPANISIEKQPSFIDAYNKMEELKSAKNGDPGWHFEIVEEIK